MKIVECIEVTKTYQQGQLSVRALKDISLEITRGEFLAVAGPSGSGKTTLLNMIGGLDRFDSGNIIVDGAAYENMSQSQLAYLRLHKIGFVFQAYNLIPVLTARENVEFVMQVQGLGAGEAFVGGADHDRQRCRLGPDLAAGNRGVEVVTTQLLDPGSEGLGLYG